MRLTVPGDAAHVRKAMQALSQSDLFAALPTGLRQNAEIVLAEVLNNVVEHAFAQHAGEITLVLNAKPEGLSCQITDTGSPMPGFALPQGQFQPLDRISDLPEGGFGWFLIRSLTENLIYRREQGANILSFRLIDEQSAHG